MTDNRKWSTELRGLLAIASGICLNMYCHAIFLRMIIPVALFIMLYPAMLEVEFRQMKRAMRKPGLMLAALFMNFFFSPFLIFGLLQLLLAKQDKTLMIGLVLYGIMPCGAMVPAFTSRLRGNVALSTAILTVSLIFSLGIVPLWCKHLIGT